EDVARLLLHHAVEALHQRAGEDARVRRQAEEPEGEEGVEALPIPHAQEAPLRVARAHSLAGGDGNAVVREHAFQERGVTALLVGLHGDRLAQQGITLDLGHGVHARAGGALARHRLGPEGQRAQALEVAVAQLGPAHVAHLVGVEGVDELPAEERLVLGAADVRCWHACCAGQPPPLCRAHHPGARLRRIPTDLTGYGALPMVAPMPRALLALALCLLAACGRDESACNASRSVTPLDPAATGTITGTVTFAGPPPAMKLVALGGDPQSAIQHQGPVTCDVHPWMRGYLGVLPHPYFAVTGADGRFTLRGVPAGEYVLAAWHERFGTREAPLTLGAGETKDVAFAYAGGGN